MGPPTMANLLTPLRSLKIRITLAVLLVFVSSLWVTLQYIRHTLGSDLRAFLEAEQFAVATVVADDINGELHERLEGLKATANMAEKAMLTGPVAIQIFIEQKPVLHRMFNGGIVVHSIDGTAIADFPASAERLGVNYMDLSVVATALKEGRASIGDPIIGKKLNSPVFGMAVPIRNHQGNVIGALSGVINLGLPNFLDRITKHSYAKIGSHLLINPQQRQIVAATDKSRIMERLPEPGVDSVIDLAMNGKEGATVFRDRDGVEQLAAGKNVPVSGWYLVTTLSAEEAFAPIYGMRKRLLLIGLVMTAFVGGVIRWIVKRQLAPMDSAALALSSMFTQKQALQPLPVVRDDEVGQLVGGFNKMIKAVGHREVALRRVQAELEGTLNAIPDLMFECDVKGLIVGYRAHRSNLLAAPPEVFIGKHFSDVLPQDAAAACMEAIHQAQVLDHSIGHQYQLLIDGRTLWFELSVARKPGAATAAAHFVVLARNVTESRMAQEELQQSRDDLRALANRLQTIREEQRAHLAREIHDVLAQELTRLKIDLSWMKRRLGSPVEEPLRENLLVRVGQAMGLIDSSITTVQRIATELRPVVLDSLGLFAAIEWQVDDFAQRVGLLGSTAVPQDVLQPEREISIVLFRILQESLTNIARHANATEVHVKLALEINMWVLTVSDNGVGITEAQISAQHSLGLLGMGERALAIGGSVHFEGFPSSGTTITARVPSGA